MTVVLPVRQRTPEWREARTHGIGASDAAAAIGVSEWQSPIGLWAEKLGLVPPASENASMRIGTALEPLIADMYTELTGTKIRRANNLRQHAAHTFMLASIDRRAGRKPVELKFSARATGYGEPGTDEVPDDVLVQVLHQLAVLDENEADVALLKPGAQSILIYPISRSAAAEAKIIEREGAFWDHVQSRTQPDVDGSEATRAALAALYPRDTELVTIEADEPSASAMRQLRLVRQKQDAIEAVRAELEAQIQAAMLAAGAEVITAPVGQIPWRAMKDRTTTDWKSVSATLAGVIEQLQAVKSLAPAVDALLSDAAGTASLDDITSIYTTTTPSKPRFGPPKWIEEE